MVPSSGVAVSVPPGVLPSYQQSQMLAQAQVAVITTASPPAIKEGILESAGITDGPVQEPEVALETDKRAIYRHPLYPLLTLLFEKCEQATQTPDCPSSESFGMDIQQFVHQQERDRKPFFSEDPDLDSLMMKAIQVLRIHLLELEKVNDLCKDFCARYMSCLKGKLQSEQLLRVEGSDFDLSPPGTPQPQNHLTVQQVMTSAGSNMVIQQGIPQPAVTMATLNQGQLVSGGTVYQMVQTPQGIVAQPVQIQTAPVQTAITPGTPLIHGSTPISQIGVVTTPGTPSTTSITAQFTLPTTPTSPIDDDDPLGKKKNKRGILPKSATQVMRSWLFQHIVHPYPSEDEKRQIAAQTNLTLLQVNNWFINARRRILQPMLDSSNPEQNKAKKSRPQNRPVQRFWPESIANIQPQLSSPSHTLTSEGEELEHDQAEVTLSTAPGEVTLTTAERVIGQHQSILTTVAGQHMPHQILLPAGQILTADGHVISTTATSSGNLVSLQGSQLTSVLGHVPQVSQATLLVHNGQVEEGLQQTANDTELTLDNSDSSSLAE